MTWVGDHDVDNCANDTTTVSHIHTRIPVFHHHTRQKKKKKIERREKLDEFRRDKDRKAKRGNELRAPGAVGSSFFTLGRKKGELIVPLFRIPGGVWERKKETRWGEGEGGGG